LTHWGFVFETPVTPTSDRAMMELVTIVDPPYPTGTSAPGAVKNRISSVIPPTPGKPSVLLFVTGAFCQHCMAQLNEVATRLSGRLVGVSVISASTVEDLQEFPWVPVTLEADPRLELFRKYGVFNGETNHATIAFANSDKEVFRDLGSEPLMDAGALMKAPDLTSIGVQNVPR
jgi:hypothetical protein